MRKFHCNKRLYMIWGNHDINKKYKKFVRKNLFYYQNSHSGEYLPLLENIEVHEGLILSHLNSSAKIFVVHGHQGDLLNDYLWPVARFLVRYVWRPLQIIGFRNPVSPASNYSRMTIIENNIMNWVEVNKQMIIAGHTHRPAYPDAAEPPYLNSGCCVHPRHITGIELQNGEIALVKWSINVSESNNLFLSREIIEGPRNLKSFLI
jgi:predicted phosphodiesterase